MHRRFQRFLTTLKERGHVSYAKIATSAGFCDVDLIVVKATAPDDLTIPDRYVHDLIKIFSLSPYSVRAFSLSFGRRFGKTRCWRVALKCLALVHRLLQSIPNNEDGPFRAELLSARANGLVRLNPCHFRDSSSSYSDHYTVFVRSYAVLIDEALNVLSGSFESASREDGGEAEEEEECFPEKMREIGRMVEVLPQLQSLIDRAMDCRPAGPAAGNFLIQSTMNQIIRDSFVCYATFRTDMAVVLENLFQMPYRTCTAAFGIYKTATRQADHLTEFYEWCKSNGLCRPHEYPFVDQIPEIQLRALETFLKGMWELTDESSESTATSAYSHVGSPLSSTGDQSRELPLVKYVEEENEPLIRLDEGVTSYESDNNWENLLDASVNMSPGYKTWYSDISYSEIFVPGTESGKNMRESQKYVRDTEFDPFGYRYGSAFANGGSLIMM